MATNTFPLKYRRKSSPPPSPRMLSPIAHISPSFPTNFVSPPPKWLDSDDAFTVFSSSCSRAPSLASSDTEDAHVDFLFKRPSSALPHRLGPLFRDTTSHTHQTQCPLQRAKTSPLRSLLSMRNHALAHPDLRSSSSYSVDSPPARRSRVVSPSIRNLVLPRTPSPPQRPRLEMTPVIDSEVDHGTTLPAQRTLPRRATPSTSLLPPSSSFAEEDEYETPEISLFHSVPYPTSASSGAYHAGRFRARRTVTR